MKNLDPETRFVLPATPAPSMPPGLVELMEDLSRNVLRNNPEDIFKFCAEHMRKLLVLRDGEEMQSKKEKKPLQIKIENAIAESHKKAEKRKVLYDSLLTESALELGNTQTDEDNIDENKNNPEKLKDEIVKSVSPLLLVTEQLPQTLELNDKNNSKDKTDAEKEREFAEMETFTVEKQSLYEADIAMNETKSLQVQAENELDFAINNNGEVKHDKSNEEGPIIMDPNNVFIEKGPEIGEQNNCISTNSEDHDQLEEVKKTVCDAIAEIETAAIKTVTNLTQNLGRSMQNDSQAHLENQESVSYKGNLNSKSNLENINNENDIIEKSSTLETQSSNETEAKVNVVTIFEAADTLNSLCEKNDILDSANKSLEKLQEEMDATYDQNIENLEQSLIAQKEIDVQKHISNLENMSEVFTSNILQPNDPQGVNQITETDMNDEQLSIQIDDINMHQDSNLRAKQKELIDNSTIDDSAVNPIIKQKNVIQDNKPIITEDSKNISPKENQNMAVEKVEYPQSVADGVIEITASLEKETEPQDKPTTAEAVTENLKKTIAISDEHLNKIQIKVTENQPIDSTNNGEEDGSNNDLVDLSSSERSPRSLKSNNSGETDDATNGTSDENSGEANNSVENSENSANPSMNLETAAVTIQKVFRSFLFKSRTSTIDDETPLDIPYLADAIQDSNGIDSKAKVEEEEPRISNKERRNLGLSRMDTMLQTVNEEKSLSLSDDSSTLSGAATVIQAQVRGYLVRNKLNKTRSGSSTKSQTQSSELENDQHKNKTILNIHIVPEGSHFMSRDESLTQSLDLPLDTSPRSLTSYHSLGYDITERRKLLRREDAIQSSISPPSINNSGKSYDVPITPNDINHPGIEDDNQTFEDKSENEEVKESEISGDTTPTISTTAETVIEIMKEIELNSESNEIHVSTSQEKDKLSEPQTEIYSGIMHSGEFHDVVLPPQPTQLSRDKPKYVPPRGE